MTQEERKNLLLRDLCARLPYGVIVHCKGEYDEYHKVEEIDVRDGVVRYFEGMHLHEESIVNCFPYLRPMSSMTEEEKFELKQEHVKDQQLFAEVIVVLNNTEMRGKVIPHFAADWCDKNMFDYRGLIDKGRAIKVTEDNNPYKK